MSILNRIEDKMTALKEQNIEPENIHIDYQSLVELCSELDIPAPAKGAVCNMVLMGKPVTISIGNERALQVN